MLRWALIFFALALLAAMVGFGGVSVPGAEPGQIAFVVFVALYLVASVLYVFRGRRPPI